MICKNCRRQISNTAKFCGYCKAKVEDYSESILDNDSNYAENIKSNKSKNILSAIGIVCLAVLIGVGAFYVVKYSMSNSSSEQVVQNTQSQIDKEEIKIDSDNDNVDIEDETIDTNDVLTTSDDKEEIPIRAKNNVRLTCKASSTLPNYQDITYYAKNAFDGNINTCWVEGASENGIGEYLSVSFSEPINIQAFGFDNGYSKTERLYSVNSRPKKLKFVLYTKQGTEEAYFSFDDTYDGDFFFHYSDVFEAVNSIDIYIEEVYQGTKYTDTCITDIFFYDENVEIITFDK